MKRHIIFFLLLGATTLSVAQPYNDLIATYREKYKQDFLEDERSPLHDSDLKYLRFFDADENYRVTADFKKTDDAVAFDIPTMNGKTKKYIEYGTLTFVLQNKTLSLKLYQGLALMEKPELWDYLFCPFTDLTNGKESYINGRYLDFKTVDIIDDKLVIDFNKAYNPYCAFAAGYSCPKPPEENDLQVIIRAGEKKFGKSIH